MAEVDKEQIVRYSRLILRKLGHRLPKEGWIQTCSSATNQQLAAFCKHCKSPFAIWGPFGFSNGVLTEHDHFMIFRIGNDAEYDTNRAWKESRSAAVRKDVVTTIGYRDFNPGAAYNLLFAMMGKNPPANVTKDPEEILNEKIKSIESRYICEKLRAWT